MRSNFLPEIVAIRLSALPLRDSLTFATNEEKEFGCATVLAALLHRMPKVATIDAGGKPTLHHMLGTALKLFVKRFVNITQINLSLHGVPIEEEEEEDEDEEDYDDDDKVMLPPPHHLAQALADGLLPGIRYLDLSAAGWGSFMCRKANLLLLRQAIEEGHLASLVDLKAENLTIIHALRTSFGLCYSRTGQATPGSIVVNWTQPGPGTPRIRMRLGARRLGEIFAVPGVTNPDADGILTYVTMTGVTFLFTGASLSRNQWHQQMFKKELQPYQPPSPPLPGQAQAAPLPVHSWYVPADSFRAEYATFLRGDVSKIRDYLGPVYNHALPALSTKLQSKVQSLAAKGLRNASCPWDVETADGLHKALVATNIKEVMFQRHGDKGARSKLTKFMDWVEEKAAEEGGPAKKKQKQGTLPFVKT